jgi:hypothetical protein
MNFKKTLFLIAALTCGARSIPAVAQNLDETRGWYGGLDVGQSTIEQDASDTRIASSDDSFDLPSSLAGVISAVVDTGEILSVSEH